MQTFTRALHALLAVVALTFVAVVVTAPASLSGLGYASALVAIAGAGVVREGVVRRRLRGGACGLAAVTMMARLVVASGGSGDLRMGTPASTGARWLDRIVDEQDLAVNASRTLAWTHVMRDPDIPELAPVMRDAYRRMREAEGATPSPVIATYAGLERPGDDDTIEIGDVEASPGVVVFLHGFAGSFTLPCWVVSRAAARAGFATVCPSTRWIGDWWSPEGEATLRETVARLQGRGARRLVLAGLSNGGIGASLLVPRMHGSFDGMVLLSGASPAAPASHLPALVLQGERDAQVSAGVVRAYADRVGARYLSLDAGHFAMLTREEEVVDAIAGFLRALPPPPATGTETAQGGGERP